MNMSITVNIGMQAGFVNYTITIYEGETDHLRSPRWSNQNRVLRRENFKTKHSKN